MRRFLDTKKASGIIMASLMSFLLVALFTSAATTISTSINTGGTLDVTGASTLTGAVTMSAAATVGTNFTVDTTTFYVDGTNNRVGVLTITPNTALEVVGTASSTSLIVGGDSTNGTIAGMVFGTCNLTSTTLTASTTQNFACTSAAGVRSGDKVFVMATSSLVSGSYNPQIFIRAASSSIINQINVDLFNEGITPGGTQTVSGTLNFWAVR
ncbi:MAG: hypothetical protein HZC14_00105 [Candidatus Niyogibacteria bacterium]|nr:hypothetical protein [Candidatus Niyogibacteria bacterium]